MSGRYALAALMMLTGLSGARPAADPAPPAALRRGLTREEVKGLLGPPRQVSRQILSRRHIEQWHYTDPPRRVEFNCPRGDEPYVTFFTSGS